MDGWMDVWISVKIHKVGGGIYKHRANVLNVLKHLTEMQFGVDTVLEKAVTKLGRHHIQRWPSDIKAPVLARDVTRNTMIALCPDGKFKKLKGPRPQTQAISLSSAARQKPLLSDRP